MHVNIIGIMATLAIIPISYHSDGIVTTEIPVLLHNLMSLKHRFGHKIPGVMR